MFFTLIFAALLSVSLAQRGPQDVLSPSFYNFDFQLLQELSQQERNNWIISPASIKTTLGLILEGASGSTATEISRVLRISRNITVARTELRKVQKRIQNTPNGITVKSGSVLLAKQGLGIKNKFRTNADLYYSANITVSDFNNPQFVTKEVNKWINGLTNGNIPYIVSPDSISTETILLLANAVYFKGNWKVEFTARPSKDCFYNPECNMVQMMGTTGAFKYGEIRSLNARVLEMPYEDPRYSMIILLPKDKLGLQDVALDIQFNSVVDFLDNLATVEVNVVMPKFAIEYSLEMKPLLQKYALEKMFSDDADFSELFQSRTRAKVSSLLHKAKIEVTEKGTEAAGATVAQFQLLSTQNKRSFIVDHPFFFFVRDTQAGFLFQGQINSIGGSPSKDLPLKKTEVSSIDHKETTTKAPLNQLSTKRNGVRTHAYPFYGRNDFGYSNRRVD